MVIGELWRNHSYGYKRQECDLSWKVLGASLSWKVLGASLLLRYFKLEKLNR